MFILFIKQAIRNLLRNRVFTFVNLMGLSIGIAASLLIFQFVVKELGYDRFHNHAEDIYRIRLDRFSQGELAEHLTTSCGALPPLLGKVFPEVVCTSSLANYQLEGIISYNNSRFTLQRAFFASADFFKLFSFPVIQGNSETMLTQPFTVAVSESLALKLFGTNDPLDKVVRLNKNTSFKVAGVFKDVPQNSHLKFDILFSMQTMFDTYGKWTYESWYSDVMFTYVQLAPESNPVEFERKLNAHVHRLIGEELKKRNIDMKFCLQPLTAIHLHSDYPGEAEQNGDWETVFYLSIIAILIMIIAWVNYINLATARSMERARDIGMRKIAGATRGQLMRQIIFESLFLNVLAVVISLIIIEIVHPVFSDWTGMNFDMGLWENPLFWVAFAIVILLGSLFSGFYPAFVLSSFKPANIISRRAIKTGGSIFFRKVLLVFQFTISIMLIAGTFTIFKQISYLKNLDLGIETGETIVVKGLTVYDSTWINTVPAFKQEIKSHPSVNRVCASYFVPGEEVWFTTGIIRHKDNPRKNSRILNAIFIDENYMDFYHHTFIAGDDLYDGCLRDSMRFILNRSAVELLGYKNPNGAIGDWIETPSWKHRFKVLGVIEDFHHESPKEKIMPTIYVYSTHPRWAKQFSINIHPGRQEETIMYIKTKYEEYFPENPFEYFYLDKFYNNQYKADINFGKVFIVFTLLAVIIAIMGMFALSLFFMIQRSKEIAVRKVLGASLGKLFLLLTKDYFGLLLVSAIIAFPLVNYFISNWLQNYVLRISLGWWFYLVPLLAMSLVILVSISYQVIKTARVNPAESLKYE